MKAVIPLAGKGTRLRPHTYSVPKPLLRVAGQPVMSYILDDLLELGITEVVFVVGYLQDVVRQYIRERYPRITPHFVVQEVQDGTAGAVKLAEPFVDDELLILFVDTIFDTDLSLTARLDETWSGILWAKEVEDYQRYGVIVHDEHGAMTRIVEKPNEPISKLANIGLYYIRDYALLFEGINHTLAGSLQATGEYFLTDAFQYMVDHGARLFTGPVEGWYDCGKPETLLSTNRHLLASGRAGKAPEAMVDTSDVDELTRIESGAIVRDSTIGPNVTIERGARVVGSTLRDCIIGADAHVEGSDLHDSLVGSRARVEGVTGEANVGEDSWLVP